LFVGEVDLIFIFGPASGGLGTLPRAFSPFLPRYVLSFPASLRTRRLLFYTAFAHGPLSFAWPSQWISGGSLAALVLPVYPVPPEVRYCPTARPDASDLLPLSLTDFPIDSLLPAQRFVFAGTRLYLSTIQADCAKLQGPHSLCYYENINEKALQLIQKTFSKCIDAVMIRMSIGAQVTIGNAVIGRLFMPAAGKGSAGVAVE
jgi:hypothetical protein